MPGTALVTGGTGFVGSHLVDALLAQGWSVRCTVRSTSDTRWINGPDIERVEADLRADPLPSRLLKGVDAVYHVAGVIRAPSLAVFREGNVGPSRRLAEAAVRAGVGRFIHVSSLAAGGPSEDGRPIDESMPPRPVSLYGRSKWEGEKAVRDLGNEIDVRVVRPPVVYGPRDNGMLELFQMLVPGILFSIGAPKRISTVHIRDFVSGMLLAGESPAASGNVYYICNPRAGTMTAFLSRAMWIIRGGELARVRIPDGLVRALGTLSEWVGMGQMFGRDKALEMTQKGWICTPERAERELGFRSVIDDEKGLEGTIQWYRAEGLLP